MVTTYTQALRSASLDIDALMEEHIRFIEAGTAEDRYSQIEGIYAVQAAVKSYFIGKITPIELQEETYLQERKMFLKTSGARRIYHWITNKRDKTIAKIDIDEVETFIQEQGWRWDGDKSEWNRNKEQE